MYVLLLLVVDAVIFMLLRPISGSLALLFLILAIVSIPALILHRREVQTAPECGHESESAGRGWVRLAGNLGLDLTGVALAALIIIACALVLRSLSAAGLHG
ncbi:MAG TPA: hypothetical protein VIO57_10510 [Chloroflexota bacterium]